MIVSDLVKGYYKVITKPNLFVCFSVNFINRFIKSFKKAVWIAVLFVFVLVSSFTTVPKTTARKSGFCLILVESKYINNFVFLVKFGLELSFKFYILLNTILINIISASMSPLAVV